MYIPNRILATCYRLITAAISGLAVFFIVHSYGHLAFRLFPTWVAIAALLYFFSSGVATYFSVKRDFAEAICPTLQGTLIVSGFLMLVLQFVCLAQGLSLPGAIGLIGTLTSCVMPLLFLFDWLLFSKKGFWRAVDPFYWLALPVCFVATSLIIIILSANADTGRFVYPFFNFPAIGLDTMLWYFGIAATLILIFGYLCFILDFTISGRLGEHVVLPKIKTIIVEEDLDHDTEKAEEKSSLPSEDKAQKVNTGSKKTNSQKPSTKTKTQPAKSRATKPQVIKPQPAQTSPAKKGAKSTKTTQKTKQPATVVELDNMDAASDSSPVKIGGLKDSKSAKHLHASEN